MESLPTEADDAAARRERKLAAKVWNDRLKSVVAIMQGVVLILTWRRLSSLVPGPDRSRRRCMAGGARLRRCRGVRGLRTLYARPATVGGLTMEAFYFEFALIGAAVTVVAPLLLILYVLNRRFERRWGKR